MCYCYGEPMYFTSKKKAIAYFEEAMMCTEGAERERYFNIWCQLKDGNTVCYDY